MGTTEDPPAEMEPGLHELLKHTYGGDHVKRWRERMRERQEEWQRVFKRGTEQGT